MSDQRSISLEELFTPEQLAKIEEIYAQHGNTTACHKALKAYFGTFSAQLLEKGAVADYMAYAIPFHLERSGYVPPSKEARNVSGDPRNN